MTESWNKPPLKTHSYVFNKADNGGESLCLTTKFFANGDPGGIFTNQELTLRSYCNSVTFNLAGATITPEMLRELAEELAAARLNAAACCRKGEQ